MPKLQFLTRQLETGLKSESTPIDLHVKMLNFTTEVNVVTAWYRKQFWSLQLIFPFMTALQGLDCYTTHPFELYYVLKLRIIILVAALSDSSWPRDVCMEHLSSTHFHSLLILGVRRRQALPRWFYTTMSFKTIVQETCGWSLWAVCGFIIEYKNFCHHLQHRLFILGPISFS